MRDDIVRKITSNDTIVRNGRDMVLAINTELV